MSRGARPTPGATDAGSSDPITAGRRWSRQAGVLIGLTLVVAAVFAVWRQRESVGAALSAISHPSLPLVLVLAAAVALNVILSGLVLGLLYERYGRVGRLEMQAVVASATLMNYLPLRAGMFGRVAYHKAVNDITVRDSVKVIAQALVLTSAVAAYLAGATWVFVQVGWPLWIMALVPAPVLAVVAAAWPDGQSWCLAAIVRMAEVLVWAVRYWAAFALVGLEISPAAAVGFACIGVVAMLVPFVSNGLGVREWMIGLLAPIVASYQLELGITAELVNRAVEIVVVMGLGLVGMTYLARRGSGSAAEAPGAQGIGGAD